MLTTATGVKTNIIWEIISVYKNELKNVALLSSNNSRLRYGFCLRFSLAVLVFGTYCTLMTEYCAVQGTALVQVKLFIPEHLHGECSLDNLNCGPEAFLFQ